MYIGCNRLAAFVGCPPFCRVPFASSARAPAEGRGADAGFKTPQTRRQGLICPQLVRGVCLGALGFVPNAAESLIRLLEICITLLRLGGLNMAGEVQIWSSISCSRQSAIWRLHIIPPVGRYGLERNAEACERRRKDGGQPAGQHLATEEEELEDGAEYGGGRPAGCYSKGVEADQTQSDRRFRLKYVLYRTRRV